MKQYFKLVKTYWDRVASNSTAFWGYVFLIFFTVLLRDYSMENPDDTTSVILVALLIITIILWPIIWLIRKGINKSFRNWKIINVVIALALYIASVHFFSVILNGTWNTVMFWVTLLAVGIPLKFSHDKQSRALFGFGMFFLAILGIVVIQDVFFFNDENPINLVGAFPAIVYTMTKSRLFTKQPGEESK